MYYYFDKVISSLIGIFIFWRFLKWKKKKESVLVAEESLKKTITVRELVICIVYYSKLKFSLSVQLSLTSYYYYKIFALVGLSELYITFTLLPTFGTEFPALIHFLFVLLPIYNVFNLDDIRKISAIQYVHSYRFSIDLYPPLFCCSNHDSCCLIIHKYPPILQ